jgi:hypothetical protein
MIPKAGDVCDINPLFKKAYLQRYNGDIKFGEEEDGHIHVKDILLHYDGSWFVVISKAQGYLIDKNGFSVTFSAILSNAPLFVPIVKKVFNLKFDLKAENTKAGVTCCVACGGLLKDPGMGPKYKYCPKCEP